MELAEVQAAPYGKGFSGGRASDALADASRSREATIKEGTAAVPYKNGTLKPLSEETGCRNLYGFFRFGTGNSSYIAVISRARKSRLSTLSTSSISFAPA